METQLNNPVTRKIEPMNLSGIRVMVKRMLKVFLGTNIGELFLRKCLKISDHFHLGNF